MFYPRYFPQQEEPLCKPFLGNWIKKPVLVKFANLLFGFFWRVCRVFCPFPFIFPPMHHGIYWQSYRAKLSLESYFPVVKCVNIQLSKENTSPLSFISDSPAWGPEYKWECVLVGMYTPCINLLVKWIEELKSEFDKTNIYLLANKQTH